MKNVRKSVDSSFWNEKFLQKIRSAVEGSSIQNFQNLTRFRIRVSWI